MYRRGSSALFRLLLPPLRVTTILLSMPVATGARPTRDHGDARNTRTLPTRVPSSVPTASRSSPVAEKRGSKLFNTMKRSFSPRHHQQASSSQRPGIGMYSTPEERTQAPSRFLAPESPPNRPTIEEIGMGLHISRTPHFSPHFSPPSLLQRNRARSVREGNSRSESLLQPTSSQNPSPIRSALKRTSLTPSMGSSATPATSTAASMSTTTITSTAPTSARSSTQSLKMRMSRFLSKTSSQSSPMAPPEHPRKAVRFSTEDVS